MTTPANDAPTSDRKNALHRWRPVVAALVLVVLVVLGVGWYVRQRDQGPLPPPVEMGDADLEVVQAVEAARAAVREAPRSAAAWGHLGMVLLAHTFIPEATVCLARAAELDPVDGCWAYLHAMLVLQTDEGEGLARLEKAVALCGDVAAPRLSLAEALLERGCLDEAEEHLRQVLLTDPHDPRAHLGLGRLAAVRGQWRASREHLTRSAQRGPAVRATHVLLAEVHHRLGDEAAAGQALRQIAAGDEAPWPDPYTEAVKRLRVGVQARVDLATHFHAQGRGREAARVLQEAVQRYPDSQLAHQALGRLLVQLGEPAAGEPALRRATTLGPETVGGRCDLGFALLRQRKFHEAADCYRQAAALKPRHALAHYGLGHCLRELGDEEGALEAFRTAVRCKPDFGEGYRALGSLLAQNGRDAEAIVPLQQALQIQPDDASAKKLLEQSRARTARPAKP